MAVSADTLPERFADFAAPEISDHARHQYDDRTPSGAAPIERAYYDAAPIPAPMRRLLRTGMHPTPDEMRVYAGTADGQVYGVVFVVQAIPDPVIRTVYTIQSRYEPEVRAYLWALATRTEDVRRHDSRHPETNP